MEKNKKIIIFTIVFIFLFSTIVFADGPEDRKDSNYTYKTIRSQTFMNGENVKKTNPTSDVQILAPIYDPGTVRIDDMLAESNGFVDSNYGQWSSYEVAKSVFFEIISFIPYGDKVGDIVGWVEAVFSDVSNLDKSAQLGIRTRYSERPFYHDIYVFDYDYSWEYIGYSKSYYYYTQIQLDYVREDTGDADTEILNKVEPDYSPHTIKVADHYIDYSYLTFIADDSWRNNRKWYEYPRNYIRPPSNYVRP